MELHIRPFMNSHQYAMEIWDFEPSGGEERFLKRFCQFTGADFLDWYQNWWDGIGHIRMNNEKMTVAWRDFPLVFSFDCETKKQAEDLLIVVSRFLDQDAQQASENL